MNCHRCLGPLSLLGRSRLASIGLLLLLIAEPAVVGCAVTNHYLLQDELPPAPPGQEGRRITIRGYTQCAGAKFNPFRGGLVAVGPDSLRFVPKGRAAARTLGASPDTLFLVRAEVPTVAVRKISGSRTAWVVFGLSWVALIIGAAASGDLGGDYAGW